MHRTDLAIAMPQQAGMPRDSLGVGGGEHQRLLHHHLRQEV